MGPALSLPLNYRLHRRGAPHHHHHHHRHHHHHHFHSDGHPHHHPYLYQQQQQHYCFNIIIFIMSSVLVGGLTLEALGHWIAGIPWWNIQGILNVLVY